MREIFTDIYNKVLGFFRQAEQRENAKDVARNRLRVVLMQDRTNLNPALLERMRQDLVALLSKYLEMDKDALELNLEHDGEQMALMLSIPVIRAKDEDEIEEASTADEEIGKREEEAEEDTEEDTEAEIGEEEISEDIEEETEEEEVDEEQTEQLSLEPETHKRKKRKNKRVE
ncbi:MAG: cell division topological specificity factor MinE [Heliobacteriaceae bacterium]|jgi:cell division topological specificity factor|nr:cell division topological specificity factor MinE [Heliobacteriaceae bacterium]